MYGSVRATPAPCHLQVTPCHAWLKDLIKAISRILVGDWRWPCLALPLASVLASDAWTLGVKAEETTKGRSVFLDETVMNNCNDAQSARHRFGAHGQCQGISDPHVLGDAVRTGLVLKGPIWIRYLCRHIASSCTISPNESRRRLLEACVEACC